MKLIHEESVNKVLASIADGEERTGLLQTMPSFSQAESSQYARTKPPNQEHAPAVVGVITKCSRKSALDRRSAVLLARSPDRQIDAV